MGLDPAIGLRQSLWMDRSGGEDATNLEEEFAKFKARADYLNDRQAILDCVRKTLQTLDNPFGPRLSPMS